MIFHGAPRGHTDTQWWRILLILISDCWRTSTPPSTHRGRSLPNFIWTFGDNVRVDASLFWIFIIRSLKDVARFAYIVFRRW
jgi:hypothetical protein